MVAIRSARRPFWTCLSANSLITKMSIDNFQKKKLMFSSLLRHRSWLRSRGRSLRRPEPEPPHVGEHRTAPRSRPGGGARAGAARIRLLSRSPGARGRCVLWQSSCSHALRCAMAEKDSGEHRQARQERRVRGQSPQASCDRSVDAENDGLTVR